MENQEIITLCKYYSSIFTDSSVLDDIAQKITDKINELNLSSTYRVKIDKNLKIILIEGPEVLYIIAGSVDGQEFKEIQKIQDASEKVCRTYIKNLTGNISF